MTAAAAPPHGRTVLAVLDEAAGGAEAVAQAGALAVADGARLVLLAAVEMPTPRELERVAHRLGQSPQEIRVRLERRARERLAAAAAGLAGPAPSLLVRDGRLHEEIIRAVLADGHALVVKAAEELGTRGRHLLASTDQHLLRKCPAPVWLHRAGAGPGPGRPVVAAIDVDTEGAHDPALEAALNARILDTAMDLAALTGAAVCAVNAFGTAGEGLVRLWGADGEAEAGRYRDEVEREHWAALTRLMAEARDRREAAGRPPVKLSSEVRNGKPRDAIPAFVEEVNGGLLVMGTVARTGVPGLLIGNTAEDVLNSVDVSLVAVKPPGYVSPLAAALGPA